MHGNIPRHRPLFRVPTASLAVLLGCFLATLQGQQSETRTDEPPAREVRTVYLVIDYADGCEKHFPRLAWRPEMTVGDLVREAAEHPRGIEVQTRGDGATAFLERIDDRKNEGGRGRNWIFRVNGKLAGRGMGVTQLRPGDRVEWEFAGAGA